MEVWGNNVWAERWAVGKQLLNGKQWVWLLRYFITSDVTVRSLTTSYARANGLISRVEVPDQQSHLEYSPPSAAGTLIMTLLYLVMWGAGYWSWFAPLDTTQLSMCILPQVRYPVETLGDVENAFRFFLFLFLISFSFSSPPPLPSFFFFFFFFWGGGGWGCSAKLCPCAKGMEGWATNRSSISLAHVTYKDTTQHMCCTTQRIYCTTMQSRTEA
jgi:hypothetical protein